jgi:hypothetical protein
MLNHRCLRLCSTNILYDCNLKGPSTADLAWKLNYQCVLSLYISMSLLVAMLIEQQKFLKQAVTQQFYTWPHSH